MSYAAPSPSSPFAGMSPAQLQAALTSAQTALINLVSGAQVVTLSYAQGAGSRSATYARTDEVKLRQLIRELQAALGTLPRRHALRVRNW